MGWLQPLRAAKIPPHHAVRLTPPFKLEGLSSSWPCVACRVASSPAPAPATYTPSPPSLRLASGLRPLSSLSSFYSTSSSLSSPLSSSLLFSSPLSSSSSSPLSSYPRLRLAPRPPVLPTRSSARFCSAMCRSRAGLEGSASANVQGRELLPANVVPRHYHLTVEPDFEKLTYNGSVVIDLDVAETSNSVSLHTLELDIHGAKLTSGGQAVRLAIPPPLHSVFRRFFRREEKWTC